MAAALFVGVLAWLSVDVAVAEMRINPSDPSTWPNMGPAIRLFLVPQLSLVLIILALAANVAFGVGTRRPLSRMAHWVALGISYSLPALSLFVAHLGTGIWPALALTCLCAISAGWFVINRFGQRESVLSSNKSLERTREG
jgi:hypothetical protein